MKRDLTRNSHFVVTMLKAVVLFLCIVLVAEGENTENINDFVDKALFTIDMMLTGYYQDRIELPGVTLEDPHIELSLGQFLGFNSWVRRGDCTKKTFENNTLHVDLHVGFNLFQIYYGQIYLNRTLVSGAFDVRNNSLLISYDVSMPKCEITLLKFEFDVMDDVHFESNNSEFSGDVSEEFRRRALPLINEKMQRGGEMVMEYLQAFTCHPIDDINVKLVEENSVN